MWFYLADLDNLLTSTAVQFECPLTLLRFAKGENVCYCYLKGTASSVSCSQKLIAGAAASTEKLSAKMNSVSVYGITCRNSNLIAQGFSTYGRALQAIDLHCAIISDECLSSLAKAKVV
nr:F-box/LRR-repeat protein 2 [Ipomoea batatas]